MGKVQSTAVQELEVNDNTCLREITYLEMGLILLCNNTTTLLFVSSTTYFIRSQRSNASLKI